MPFVTFGRGDVSRGNHGGTRLATVEQRSAGASTDAGDRRAELGRRAESSLHVPFRGELDVRQSGVDVGARRGCGDAAGRCTSPGLSYAVHQNPHVSRINKTAEISNFQISTSYGCVSYDAYRCGLGPRCHNVEFKVFLLESLPCCFRELCQYRWHKGEEIFSQEPTSLGFVAILTPPS